jgi:stage II sporulation protein D
MKRFTRRSAKPLRFICLLLCAVTLTSFAPPQAAAAIAANPTLRVGLSFGPGALISANLQNHTGAGYEFGFLDADMQFISLGHTGQTRITMIKNRTVYLLSDGTYSETVTDRAVGAFHTPHGAFSSREEAEAESARLRGQGIQAFVSWRNWEWLVRSDSFTGSGDGARVTGSNRAISIVVTGTTDIIFQFDAGEAHSLCVRPLAPEGTKARTWHRQRIYYGLFEFSRRDGNDLTVVNVVDMQDYVKGILPYEMSPSWPLEALKAQAVTARSYAVTHLTRHRGDGFNLCTEVHCHVYRGTAQASENSDRAVDETFGHYLTHNGQPCRTFYYSSNGGATEDSENVWLNAIPYLRGVPDPYEDASRIPGYHWSFTVTNTQISQFLNSIGHTNSGVSAFFVDRFTDMGNVFSITILDSTGRTLVTHTRESARSFIGRMSRHFGFYPAAFSFSQRFTVSSGDSMLTAASANGAARTHSSIPGLFAINGQGAVSPLPPQEQIYLIDGDGRLSPLPANPDSNANIGVYTVRGSGLGHNVGMSQWGARLMAERGYTYDRILRHYFTGVEVVTAQ